MRFAVPRESLRHEHRVGLTPFASSRLVEKGHQVFVEHDAGKDSHFSDRDYTSAGATVVYRADEVYGRAEVVCRVGPLSPADVRRVREDTAVVGFLQLGVGSSEAVRTLQERRVTLIGYELIEDGQGNRPLLNTFSEIAGQMAVHIAGHLLEYESGGRGLLLGGIPGISPPQVVVLGAGHVGSTAAERFSRMGAQVHVLDNDVERLRAVMDRNPHIYTALASPRHVRRFSSFADVLVGAVFIPGGRVPWVVSEDMVKAMKPGSVIIDVSIDQGGCVETSRPTTLESPTFTIHNVIHYCVPNIASNMPRVSSRALSMGALRYLERMGDLGLDEALKQSRGLASGLYLYRGEAVNPATANSLGLTYPHVAISELLADRAQSTEE